jgi:hypothetical protein
MTTATPTEMTVVVPNDAAEMMVLLAAATKSRRSPSCVDYS